MTTNLQAAPITPELYGQIRQILFNFVPIVSYGEALVELEKALAAAAPANEGAANVRNALVSLECTTQWLEGGCDPKAAAIELRGVMRMLQGECAQSSGGEASEREATIINIAAKYLQIHQLRDFTNEIRSAPAASAACTLSKLLARIHRDGGHYEAEHGTQKAVAEADNIVAQLNLDADAAKGEAKPISAQRLADAVRKWFPGRSYQASFFAREVLAAPEVTADDARWVSVKDQMPDADEPVLVHNGRWTGVGAWMSDNHLEDIERWQDEQREFIELNGPAVTHWMPLPRPPIDAALAAQNGEKA